jgi:hypothetical protein
MKPQKQAHRSTKPRSRTRSKAANDISSGGTTGAGWTQSAWNASLSVRDRVLRVSGTQPWPSVAYSSPRPVATGNVRTLTVHYRASSGPLQILVFNGVRLWIERCSNPTATMASASRSCPGAHSGPHRRSPRSPRGTHLAALVR